MDSSQYIQPILGRYTERVDLINSYVSIFLGGFHLNFQFLIFDHVEELDLVGSWELVGLLAEQKKCNPPKLVTLNTMTPVGEHGMRFVADAHFSETEQADVIFVPGG